MYRNQLFFRLATCRALGYGAVLVDEEQLLEMSGGKVSTEALFLSRPRGENAGPCIRFECCKWGEAGTLQSR